MVLVKTAANKSCILIKICIVFLLSVGSNSAKRPTNHVSERTATSTNRARLNQVVSIGSYLEDSKVLIDV